MALPISQMRMGPQLELAQHVAVFSGSRAGTGVSESHAVPFDGHQLPGLVALAHQHTPVGAVSQLSHGCISVHRAQTP